MKKILDKIPYLSLGVAIVVFSSPLLYVFIASSMIDIQNLFGAGIDRRSVSYDIGDPFIQAMNLVGVLGLLLIAFGYLRGKIKHVF